MSFFVRAAQRDDLQQLYELARQFTLLNLPAEKRAIETKIERSMASFAGELSRNDAEYMFVAVDTESEEARRQFDDHRQERHADFAQF